MLIRFFFLPFIWWRDYCHLCSGGIVPCSAEALLVSSHHRLQKSPPRSLNVVAGLRSWNFQSSFMCHRDQKSVLGLWRKVGGKDIHFWPLKETLHWPMKECVVSLCKPMTIILAGPFRSDLFQPFILRFLIVSWNQLASWLWRWIGLDHKGYITKIQQLFLRTVDKNGCRVSATYLSPNHGGQNFWFPSQNLNLSLVGATPS